MKAFIILVALLALVWLVGAAVQGILVETAVTTRRIWLFTWWFEKFAFGVVVGFVLGAVVTWLGLRTRASTKLVDAGSGGNEAQRTEDELAALTRELSASDTDR